MLSESELKLWFFRVFKWDGMLPAIIWYTPTLIQMALPGRRGAVEIAAIVLPITAMFIRARVGFLHISSNHCSPKIREFQGCWFCVGILLLVFLDAFMMLSNIMPKDAPFSSSEVFVGRIFYAIYFVAMTFAMYPGKTPESELSQKITAYKKTLSDR